METRRQRLKRYLSLLIVMFNMLISCTCYSLVYGTIWPYYQKIDDSASEPFLGIIIAAFSVGLLIFSPLLGVWSNHRPLLEPLIFSLVVYMFSNLLYVLAETFKDIGKWMLLASKFVGGAASGHLAVSKSYCSAASTEEERNTVMSILTALQILGYFLGPGLSLLFHPLGEDGYEWHDANLYFNLYTGPGFLGIFLLIVSILVTVVFFKEFDVHNTKTKIPVKNILCCICHSSSQTDNKQAKEIINKKRYDRMAAIVCIFLYFLILSMVALQDSVIPPLAQDEFAWSNKEATLYVSIMFASNSLIVAVMITGTRYLVKCVSERTLLISTLLIMIVGLVIWMPYGGGHPDVKMIVLNNSTNHHPLVQNVSGDGCDVLKKSWCTQLPKIHLPQFLIGSLLVAIGRSSSNFLCFTIFSKIIGPWPQGLMMGFISMSGSFGRIITPTILTKVYHVEGPRITFLICIGMILLCVITTTVFYTRLVPFSAYEQKRKKGYTPVNSDLENSEHNIATSMPHFTNKYHSTVSNEFAQTRR